MSQSNKTPAEYFAAGLGRGCLVGVALALAFLMIGGIIYGIGWIAGLSTNIILMMAVAGGPIIGTVIALALFSGFAARANRKYNETHHNGYDESASRD